MLNSATCLMGRGTMWRGTSACPRSTKSNLRGSEITFLRPQNYGSFKFIKFVLKIGPIGGVKFGNARKMLYLCRALGKMLCECGLRLGKANKFDFSLALHHPCKSGQKREAATRCSW